MSRFIKLTDTGINKPYYVAIDHIEKITVNHVGDTHLHTTRTTCHVLESPEQILAMIEGREDGDPDNDTEMADAVSELIEHYGNVSMRIVRDLWHHSYSARHQNEYAWIVSILPADSGSWETTREQPSLREAIDYIKTIAPTRKVLAACESDGGK